MSNLYKVNYEPSTGRVLGLYDPKWQGEIPEPNKQIPQELVDNITGSEPHNHFDPDKMETSLRDLEVRDAEWRQWRRSWRDRRLNATDKYLNVPDYPITETQKQELMKYRQELRDYPDTWVKPSVPIFLSFNS